jgi:hypothetical protein
MSLKNALETAKEILAQSVASIDETYVEAEAMKKKKGKGDDTSADGVSSTSADGVTPETIKPTGKEAPTPSMKPSDASTEVVDDAGKLDLKKPEEEEYSMPDEEMPSEEGSMMMPDEEMGAEEDMHGDEEEEDDFGAKKTKKMTPMAEQLGNLFTGEELSEEFKEKAGVVFEAAVNMRVDAAREELHSEFEAQLDEEKEALASKLDEYLTYVVEEWRKENEVAIDSGIRSDISESFMIGLKNLFETHYVAMPDEKYDLVEGLNDKVDDLESKLNESIEKNIELSKGLVKAQCEALYETASRDLADSDEEKFRSMVENLDFTNVEDFQEKLSTLKENFFNEEDSVKTPLVEEFATNEEDAVRESVDLSPTMSAYTNMLSRINSKAVQNRVS